MNTNYFRSFAAILAVTGLNLSTSLASAQDAAAVASSAPPPAAPAPAAAPAPQLPYGVGQILQLQQAKVGDDTIVAYIRNSGNSYGLNADQIIYLQQQGLSSAVITAMLSQPRPGVMTSAPAPAPGTPDTPPPAAYTDATQQPSYSPSAVGPSVTAISPSVTYVQPSTVYYSSPAYYPYYPYYPYGYWGYPVGVSIGFGYGWHGGWGGGWHGGGGFHGGGFHR
jgi:hypothetical protein